MESLLGLGGRWGGGGGGHMANMATALIYGKSLLKSSTLEPLDRQSTGDLETEYVAFGT